MTNGRHGKVCRVTCAWRLIGILIRLETFFYALYMKFRSQQPDFALLAHILRRGSNQIIDRVQLHTCTSGITAILLCNKGPAIVFRC